MQALKCKKVEFLLRCAVAVLGLVACQQPQQKRLEDPKAAVQEKDTVTHVKAEAAVRLAGAMNKAFDSIKLAKYSGDAERDFVYIMQQHQAAAREMYKVVVANSEDEELKTMAQGIAKKVQKENADLDAVAPAGNGEKRSAFSETAVSLLDSLTRNGLSMHGAYLELDFSTLMAQHHFLAIELARLYLKNGRDSALLSFAQGLMASYRKDMEALSDWKKKNYPDAH